MGAMVGAMYASGKMEECKEWLYSWDKRKMWELAAVSYTHLDGYKRQELYVESQYHRGRPYIGEYLDEVTGYWPVSYTHLIQRYSLC